MLSVDAPSRASQRLRRAVGIGLAALIGSSAVAGVVSIDRAPVRAAGPLEVTAWAPYFSSNAATSLAAHGGAMSEVSPFFYTVHDGGAIVADGSDSQRSAILNAAAGKPIIPTLVDGMGPLGMASILANPDVRAEHITAIMNFVGSNSAFGGVDLDYEGFAFNDGRASWVADNGGLDTFDNWGMFLTELGAQLHAAGKRLEVSVPPIYNGKHDSSGGYWVYNYPVMNTIVDRVKVMMYDYSVSSPGALAPYNWVSTTMDYIRTVVDPGKLLLGIPAYGRDWVTKIDGSCPVSATAAKVTARRNPQMSAAFQNASRAGQTPVWNGVVHEYTYSYVESYGGADANGVAVRCNISRTVWFGDARSIGERAKLAVDKGLAGVAMWALGYEDSATWDAIAAVSAGQPINAPGPLAPNLTAPAVVAPYPTPIRSSGPLPARYLDTRAGYKTADGQYAGGGTRKADSTLELQIAGRGPVAGGTGTVVLNVTALGLGNGYVTVYPCGTRPTTSNLNVRTGQTIANTVIAKLSAAGTVCIYTQQAADLIVDVFSVMPDAAITSLVNPARLLDTRAAQPTIDGAMSGGGLLPINGVVEVPVAGRGGVNSGARSAVLNVTAVDAVGPGFLTVYPCDSARPATSNVNYVKGAAIPNAVVTALSATGTVCVFSSNVTDVIIDVAGELSPGSYSPLAQAARLMDTRTGFPTVDSQYSGAGKSVINQDTPVQIGGRAGLPALPGAVILNVTVDSPDLDGYVTVYPCGTARPNVSNVNFAPGQTIPNLVITKLSSTGSVCVFTSSPTHVLVDVFGTIGL
jgi:spore germination protein YaaH